MNTSSMKARPGSRTEIGAPAGWESLGVLGAVLAQASAVPGFGRCLAQAGFTQTGTIGLSLTDELAAGALAEILALPPSRSGTRRSGSVREAGEWTGVWAGHVIVIRVDLPASVSATTPAGSSTRTAADARPRTQPLAETSTQATAPTEGRRPRGGESAPRFAARFDSDCSFCEQPIRQSEDVSWLDGDVVHAACASEAGIEVFGS